VDKRSLLNWVSTYCSRELSIQLGVKSEKLGRLCVVAFEVLTPEDKGYSYVCLLHIVSYCTLDERLNSHMNDLHSCKPRLALSFASGDLTCHCGLDIQH
jgi:hypothetical protein